MPPNMTGSIEATAVIPQGDHINQSETDMATW